MSNNCTRPLLAAAVLAFTAHAAAQCVLDWLPGEGIAGLDNAVTTMSLVDPDGAGPLPSGILCAGPFDVAGDVHAPRLALWDGDQWQRVVGANMDVTPKAFAVMTDGSLVVAGTFTTITGVPAQRVAKWNGSTWSPLGAGVDNAVNALTVMPNGDLIAAGTFLNAGGQPARRIARWNGTAWSALGSGIPGTATNTTVAALAVRPNGELIAAGTFLPAGEPLFGNIARWDGSSWTMLGGGVNNPVYALAQTPDGALYAGGIFGVAGTTPVNFVARWDASGWSSLHTGMSGAVRWLTPTPDGHLLAGGDFTGNHHNGILMKGLGVWDGSAWSSVGNTTMPTGVFAMAYSPAGDIVLGGTFRSVGNIGAQRITRWTGTDWAALCGGIDGQVLCAELVPGGNIVVGGSFTHIGGIAARHIAIWDGANWAAMGNGLSGSVTMLQCGAEGHVTAAHAVGLPQPLETQVSAWDGNEWTDVGAALEGSMFFLAAAPDGRVFATGYFTIGNDDLPAVWWNGSQWASMTVSGSVIDHVTGFTIMPNGSVLAATNNVLWRWTGSDFTTVGSVPGFMGPIAAMPNGDLIATGTFTSIGGVPAYHIARWDGTHWWPLGAGFRGTVKSLVPMEDGRLLIVGSFVLGGNTAENGVVVWDGTRWYPLAVGLPSMPLDGAVGLNDTLLTCGDFATTDGAVSVYYARATPRAGCQPPCDTIDFNLDGAFPEVQDINDFLSVFSGGPCSQDPPTGSGCADIDFNNDGYFPDTSDIDSLLSVFGGGPCL